MRSRVWYEVRRSWWNYWWVFARLYVHGRWRQRVLLWLIFHQPGRSVPGGSPNA